MEKTKNKTISVWLKNDYGKIALQRRSADEKSFPFVGKNDDFFL
jgi:isopentenyldiphosphate isomerase